MRFHSDCDNYAGDCRWYSWNTYGVIGLILLHSGQTFTSTHLRVTWNPEAQVRVSFARYEIYCSVDFLEGMKSYKTWISSVLYAKRLCIFHLFRK